MDFHLSEDQRSVRDLAREIFTDRAALPRVVEVEASESRTDDVLLGALHSAGLLTMALPDSVGGDAMGLSGLAVVLIEQGRAVAPVPLWSSAIAAYAVARFGDSGAAERVGQAVADGGRLALALEEFAGGVEEPRCAATESDGAWRLTGEKAAVPTHEGSALVVVTARTPDGPGLFLVEADAAGVSWERAETTSRDWAANLRLESVAAQRIGGPEALTWTLRAAACALAALQLGIGEGALALTAGYLKDREQFGRSLGSFQAVQHQLADCWIDLDAMRVTMWQAVCAMDLVDTGASDAPGDDELARMVDVARYWAGQGGANLVHRTQHLHGGIGVDVDYPIHRYFLWGKQVANTLGGPQSALAALGDLLAEVEVRS
ncbi:MAG: acyl-CoA/acyl-ACP dehydrogenase [Tetrasphaera sp.]|nr:acyl-CoA/acyl-ACP dehydrogenase [Tetrasphaera sp.]